MKRYIFYFSFAVITPFAFILTLILLLSVYRGYYLSSVNSKNINRVAYAALPTAQNSFSADIIQEDSRVGKIRHFLNKYNSPLELHSDYIVEVADSFDIDHRLIPAIAMQESNLCQKIPQGSNNCWGYGIYGGKVHKFTDYKEGIYIVSKTLSQKYKKNGLVTPSEIMTRWTPSSNGSWAFSVNFFMNKLE